jgi:protein gp37
MKQAHRFSGTGGAYEGLTQLSKRGPVWTGRARFVPEMLAAPLSWRKPARVFVNSMSDLFHEDITDDQIAAVFGIMAACPRHTFQVLTKRPRRMREWFLWLAQDSWPEGPCHDYFSSAVASEMNDGSDSDRDLIFWNIRNRLDRFSWPLPNVWLGVSTEDQETADERIPHLLQTPAAVRFVSAEPLLGHIDFRQAWVRDLDGTHWKDTPATDRETILRERSRHGISWVIVGGESGPGARGFDVRWGRSIVEQCREAGVAVFFKQVGAHPCDALSKDGEWDHEKIARDWPTASKVSQRIPGHEVHKVWLNDRKGGDMAEWPEDLRVRQFPEARR